jgi:ComF family protein
MGAWLCDDCLAKIPRVLPPLCVCCGRALPPDGTARLCARCQDQPLQITQIRTAVYFEGVVRKAVHRFKYNGLTALSEPLGELMASYWIEHPVPVDVVIPVPLHIARLRERGYNQATLLARELAARVNLIVDDRLLKRQRATAPQVELNARQRMENVRDAFRCVSQGAIDGKRVLLIDDVCTTGSTLEACAVALRAGGACAVRALTLARAH